MHSTKKVARVAGFLYLIVIVSFIVAELVRSSLIVPGDAVTTTNNIMASASLFRIAFASDLIAIMGSLFSALVLYVLLKPVNKNHALLMVVFVTVSVAVTFINMLNHLAPLLLLSSADYLTLFGADQLYALVILFLDLHEHGYFIADIFFGLWLLPLGYLVFKSGYFPRILGVLLIIACFGYLIQFIQIFLFPSHEVIAYPGIVVAGIAEISFCLWLLIKGVNVQSPDSRALVTA